MTSPVTVRQLSREGQLDSILTPGGHRRYLYKYIKKFARGRNIQLSAKENTGLRALIVDDDIQRASYIEELMLLSPEIAEIKVANDGFQIEVLIYTFEPHVVLLDLRMPYLDGFNVYRDIKSTEVTKNIRAIAMSGFYGKENVKYIVSAGAGICLKKPFKIDELFLALESESVVL